MGHSFARRLRCLLQWPQRIAVPVVSLGSVCLYRSVSRHLVLQRPSDSASRLLAIGGTLMILAGILLEKPTINFCGALYFWQTSPSLFILRVGCVCFLLSIVERLSRLSWIPRTLVQSVAQRMSLHLPGPSLHPLWISLEYGCK